MIHSLVILFFSLISLQSFSKDYLQFHAAIEQIIEREVEERHFQGAILLAYKGVPFYSQNIGLADITKGIPVNSETKFRIGSISKHFLATIILRLQEQNLLSTTDRISKFLPVPPTLTEVTIHNLLTHTSSIIDKGSERWDYTKGSFLSSTPTRLKEWLGALKTKGKIGDYQYSTIDYALLAAIVELKTKKTYQENLNELIKIASLPNTGLAYAPTHESDLALGYRLKENFTKVNDFLQPTLGSEIYTSAEDLLRWSNALLNNTILTGTSFNALIGMHHFFESREDYGDYYSYGLETTYLHNNLVAFYHSGIMSGYSAYFEADLTNELTIILLSNIEQYDFKIFYSSLSILR